MKPMTMRFRLGILRRNTSSELTFSIEFGAEVKLRYLVLQDDAFTAMPRFMEIAPALAT